MGLFDQDIADSSKLSDEDKAKYKAATATKTPKKQRVISLDQTART
jgi:hypothetical protein